MAIFQVLKVVPPRKHQQSPRNFKRSQNEANKRENDEAISKQVQVILKRKQSHEVKGHHKYVPPRSPHKQKKISINLASKYRGPQECMGTTGKEGG
jgi:hypothetical protein